jgi:hypothetical protein
MMGAMVEVSTERGIRFRTKLPALIHIRAIIKRRRTGELLVLEFLWTTTHRWERREDQEEWLAIRIAGIIVALGID